MMNPADAPTDLGLGREDTAGAQERRIREIGGHGRRIESGGTGTAIAIATVTAKAADPGMRSEMGEGGIAIMMMTERTAEADEAPMAADRCDERKKMLDPTMGEVWSSAPAHCLPRMTLLP